MADPATGNQGGPGAGAPPAAASIDFSTHIPAELASEPSLKMFDLKSKDGFGNLVKSYVASQKMLGGEKMVIPRGANDTPEAWARYYEAGGRPKDPEGYQWEKPELPQGLKYDEKMEKEFRKYAHDHGLSQKQASAVYKFYHNMIVDNYKGMVAGYNNKHSEAVDTLKKEWGDKFDANVNLANKVLRTFGGAKEEVQQFVQRFANEPVVVRILASIGKRIEESALVAGENSDLDMSGEDAKKKRADIMTNKSNPLYEAFHSKKHPRHQEAMDEVSRLSKLVVGTDEVIHAVK
jgi:hypothetical protein